MAENLRLARLYFVILAIVAGGRWFMSLQGVPYAKGTDKLSIVTLTLFASLFSAAFTRRWLGYRLAQAAGFTMFMALVSQLVVMNEQATEQTGQKTAIVARTITRMARPVVVTERAPLWGGRIAGWRG